MNVSLAPLTVGAVIAVCVLVLVIVLLVLHQIPLLLGGLLAALAVSRLC